MRKPKPSAAWGSIAGKAHRAHAFHLLGTLLKITRQLQKLQRDAEGRAAYAEVARHLRRLARNYDE